MKPYVRRHRNILTNRLKAIQAERSTELLNHLKHRGSRDVHIFVDEKKFMADGVANRQNSRVIAYDLSQVPSAMHSRNPTSIIVFGAVANEEYLELEHIGI
ncbi:Hypothetical predicted protein [Octopus vulgaris]|uniref:Uncharacterized protein n=1 Tax=Octopus vulgaris TaxID=6645 RepID=A0AA36FHM2_OCTVU|nr:Hypothetical predicted protein [Octopus vulgaris]